MKIYVRKIDKQCITHQIAYTKEILNDFLGGLENHAKINCEGKNNHSKYEVEILTATDDRFNGSMQQLLKSEGNLEIGDLMIMYRISSDNYIVELVKPSDGKYSSLIDMFAERDRHILLETEDLSFDLEKDYELQSSDTEISEEDFKNWLSRKKKSNGTNLSVEYQNAYYYLLKAIPSIFDVGSVFSITDADEFEVFNNKIRSDSRFAEANPAIGQGSLSAALTNYSAYLVEKTKPILPVDILIAKLKEWYENKPVQNNVTSSLVGFGLKYGNSIRSNGISAGKLMERAGIESTMNAYIDRGVDLYFALRDESLGYKVIPAQKVINGYQYLDVTDEKILTNPGENLVVYGTPGCGKSYYVDHTVLGKDQNGKYTGDFSKDNIIRTTFFQDYSNTDFVGQVMPVITTELNNNGNEEQIVTYKFVPGPFTLALECAIANPNEKVALIIEELNRGNAPSIFGDIFQLLDRVCEESSGYPIGTSEYGIANVNIINYLSDNVHYEKKWNYSFNLNEIRIPANLYIYATMNTSDQNVFTLDTAFKRRWEFKKLKNEFTDGHTYANYMVPGMPETTWKKLVESINDFIVSDPDSIASEDKQIGVFFVNKTLLCHSIDDCDNKVKKLKFAYKLFEYLWDDVAKFSRSNWFGDIKTLDELIEKYLTDGVKVFKDGVIKND